MEATVHVSKNALDYFRKKARDCPKEIQAYLIGDVHYPNRYIISSIEHPTEYAIQSTCNVQASAAEYTRIKRIAYMEGRHIIGDIHSHPNEDAIMSQPDYEACVTDRLHLCGIVSVRKRATQVRFWLVNSALPCEISYEPWEGDESATSIQA